MNRSSVRFRQAARLETIIRASRTAVWDYRGDLAVSGWAEHHLVALLLVRVVRTRNPPVISPRSSVRGHEKVPVCGQV